MKIGDFDTLARTHRRGEFKNDVTEQIRKVIEGVMKTGKKGEVKITLSFERFQNQTGGAIKVSDKIDAKVPTKIVDPAILFVTPQFELSTTDPAQPEFEGIRSVDQQQPAGDVRRAAAE